MAEFPALPIWTDAYLGDTTHLGTLEHGAYFLLLMVAWRSPNVRLPDDDVMLARYAQMSLAKWLKIRPIIKGFYRIEDGFWIQGRLTDEATLVRQKKAAAAANGRASALKRKGRHSTERIASLNEATNEATNGPATRIQLNQNHTLYEAKASPPSGAQIEDLEQDIPPLAAVPVDPIKSVFDLGVDVLTAKGVPEGRARSLVGKWRKEQGDPETMSALLACRQFDVSNPVEWIPKRFASEKKPTSYLEVVKAEQADRAARAAKAAA